MKRPERSLLAALVIILAAALIPALMGCGKKSWPEPLVLQESFDFGALYGVRDNGCMVVKVRLEDKWENLSRVRLEFSDTDTDCPDCPFHPSEDVVLAPGDEGLTIEDDVLTVRYCGLAPGQAYRWRLVGYNVYEELEPVISPVRLTTP